MTEELRTEWQSFIGGRFTDAASGRRIPVEDPATAEIVAGIACAEAEDVDRAVQAARACVASRILVDMRPADRAAMMIRIAAELRSLAPEGARVLCLESGKSLADAEDEFNEAARYFEYYGGLADKLEGRSIPLGGAYIDYTLLEPYGVSAHIVPWNFPVSLTARSLSCAFAGGNAVVVKSPELDPLAVTFFGLACERAGVPAGAVNIICGYGADAGEALVRHPGVDHIVFTGSVPTARSILHAAADRIVPCVVELGGKSAGIVFDDADFEDIVSSTKSGIFFNAGQVCSALSRLLVPRRRHDEIVERLVDMAEGLSIGPGIDGNDLTPLISAQQLERVEGYCRSGIQAGAHVVTGGERIADRPGHFMAATIFTGVTNEMTIAREEIFGPVLCVLPYEDEADAIRIANDSDYGLVAGVFTRDLDRAHWAAARLEAGQVYVNEWFAGGIETPFGGTKRSGYGREKGQEALLNYVRTKNVAIRLDRGLPQRG